MCHDLWPKHRLADKKYLPSFSSIMMAPHAGLVLRVSQRKWHRPIALMGSRSGRDSPAERKWRRSTTGLGKRH